MNSLPPGVGTCQGAPVLVSYQGNRKIVEMGLVQGAKAIAEGKVKATISDLDRLIRLEEFLREEGKEEQTKIIFEWKDWTDGGTGEDDSESGTEGDRAMPVQPALVIPKAVHPAPYV